MQRVDLQHHSLGSTGLHYLAHVENACQFFPLVKRNKKTPNCSLAASEVPLSYKTTSIVTLKSCFPLRLCVVTMLRCVLKLPSQRKSRTASSLLTSTRDNAQFRRPLHALYFVYRDRPPCCSRSLDFTPPMFSTNHRIMQTSYRKVSRHGSTPFTFFRLCGICLAKQKTIQRVCNCDDFCAIHFQKSCQK